MSTSMQSILVMLLAGAMVALQGPINATLSRAAGSSINAALMSFLVGTVALVGIAMAQRVAPDLSMARTLPWWAWLGGLCGAVFVTGAAYAVPRLGVASMLTLGIASQLMMAVALDHVGALGIPARSVSGSRLLGIALVIAGALIVRRS